MNIIPEYESFNEAVNDLALRIQQVLIAQDLYEYQLIKVNELLPTALITGFNTKDTPLSWMKQRQPSDILDQQRKAKQFVLLNGMNQILYLIDDYMIMISGRYYNYNPEDKSWFTPDMWSYVTSIKLTDISNSTTVDDLRREMDKFRKWKMTNSYTVNEFFDIYQKISAYIVDISMKTYTNVVLVNPMKEIRGPKVDDLLKHPNGLWPPPPLGEGGKKKEEKDDYDDLREEFGEE